MKIKKIIKRLDLRNDIYRLLKFNLIGLVNLIVDLTVFYGTMWLFGFGIEVAQGVSYSAATLNSYFLNRRFTFNHQGKVFGKAFLIFIIMNLITMYMSTLMIGFVYPYIGHRLIAKGMVTVVITLINFFIQRTIVFRDWEGLA